MSIRWPDFVKIIQDHRRFLLTSHIRPDCDALGSELGMAGVLDALGKQVAIVNGQRTPPNLQFLDPQNRLQTLGEDVQMEDLLAPRAASGHDYEVLMVLDTSAWAQLGPMGDVIRATGARKIILDHHVSEDDLGAEAFKDPTSESTGALVVEAAEQLGVKLTPEIATPLFAATATDTGWFRFPSADGDAYRTAAKLVDAGAKPSTIYHDLYEQDTLGRLRLRGVVLSRVETELDGRLVHTYIRKDDFQKTGAVPSDTEDLINLTLEIAGTEGAVILVEQLSGGFKLSFRSRFAGANKVRRQMDCSQVAESFGGGGHKAAAGAFVEGPFEQVQSRVLDAVRAAMQ